MRSANLVAMLGLLAAPAAIAAQGIAPGTVSSTYGNPIARILERRGQLALTDDQAARIRAISERFEAENATELQDLRTQRRETPAMDRMLYGREAPAMRSARQSALRMDESRLAQSRRTAMADVRAVLTPEQRARLRDLLRPQGPPNAGAGVYRGGVGAPRRRRPGRD